MMMFSLSSPAYQKGYAMRLSCDAAKLTFYYTFCLSYYKSSDQQHCRFEGFLCTQNKWIPRYNRQDYHTQPGHRRPLLDIFKSALLLLLVASPPPLHMGYRAGWPCCSEIVRYFNTCKCTSDVSCPRTSISVYF